MTWPDIRVRVSRQRRQQETVNETESEGVFISKPQIKALRVVRVPKFRVFRW